MNKITFSIESKRSFSPSDWPWLLLALRQDPLVWSSLQDEEFSEHAFTSLGSNANAWSPAALSLLTFENPPELESIRTRPLKPLQQGLNLQTRQTFEHWSESPQAPDRLWTAGLLALNFREQYRKGSSWKEIFFQKPYEPDAVLSVFSCLYGMIPDPDEFLKTLLLESDEGWIKAAVHTLLANPFAPETQLTILDKLSSDLSASTVQVLLQGVASNRPQLATLFAQKLLENRAPAKSSDIVSEMPQTGANQLARVIQSLQSAHIQKVAGQPELAVTALADSLRLVRQVRGHLSAQLAGSIEGTKSISADGKGPTADEASLEAWKQAVQLVPNEPVYIAGYARVLLNLGRTQEALRLIEGYISNGGHLLCSELMLTYAEALNQFRGPSTVHQAARDSLDLFLENLDLSEQSLIKLVKLFVQVADMESALLAVQTGLHLYPGSREVLALSAKIQLETGKPDNAAMHAIASQAASLYGSGLSLASHETTMGEKLLQPASPTSTPDDESTRRVLIDSLEALQVWDSAFQERMILLEGKAEISKEEELALARCASGAGKHELAAEICRNLLLENPSNALAQGLLAKACDAQADYSAAIDHFNQAIEISPDQVDFWKGLVGAYLHSGQENAAFETLRAASQALPEDPEIHLQLGEHYLTQGSPSLALPHLKKAYSLGSSDLVSGIVATRLGETLQKLGHLSEARQIIEPEYNRNECISENNRAREKKSLVSPQLAHAYARILLAEGEPENAVQILTRVVSEDTHNTNAMVDLCKGLMELSDRNSGAKRAIPFLKRLLSNDVSLFDPQTSDSDPFNQQQRAEIRTLLAEAYSTAGEWDLALETYKQAMEEPANQEAEMQTRLSLGLGLTALKLELPKWQSLPCRRRLTFNH